MRIRWALVTSNGAVCALPASEFVLRTFDAKVDPTTRTLRGGLSFKTLKHLSSCYWSPGLEVIGNQLVLTRANQ